MAIYFGTISRSFGVFVLARLVAVFRRIQIDSFVLLVIVVLQLADTDE